MLDPSTCGASTLYNRSHDGIEFTADGHWYFLDLDDVGGLARGRGFDGEGTWSSIGANTMNGPGVFQIDLVLAGRGFNPAFFQFESNPVAMRVKWMLGATDYIGTSSPR